MKEQLMQFKKAYISLADLEGFAALGQTYEQFAEDVLALVDQKMLQPVKSSQKTFKTPSLHYKYKIIKHVVQQSLKETLERLQLTLDSRISLDAYYRYSIEQLQQDLPYLKKIHQYITTYGLPSETAPAPERSQALVGDEKWIQLKGGRRVLERIGLWDQMRIVDVKDPLRFAVNPKMLQQPKQYHLIVENKTTYEGLLPALQETCFSTLIYGAGFEIVGNIGLFGKQLPLPNVTHSFYYFGDIDFTGISIWYLLQKQQIIQLALPFYQAAFQYEGRAIPKKQVRDEEAILAFYEQLDRVSREKSQQLFEQTAYLSQEVLTSAVLQQIWREWGKVLV